MFLKIMQVIINNSRKNTMGRNVRVQNVRGTKCPWDEMSMGRNVRGRNVHGTKCPGTKCPWDEMSGDEMSMGRNVRGRNVRDEMSMGRNVRIPIFRSKFIFQIKAHFQFKNSFSDQKLIFRYFKLPIDQSIQSFSIDNSIKSIQK